MEEKEMLKIYDLNLEYIDDIERNEAHQKELLHEVVHCWIVDVRDDEPWIYLQQRSFLKNEFAGLYDISVAGHVSSGEEPELSVLREIEEEIGLKAELKDLKYLGYAIEHLKCKGYYDNELCRIFIYKTNKELDFKANQEVEKIVKVPFSEYKDWFLKEKSDICGIDIESGSKITISSKDICRHSEEAISILITHIATHKNSN
ncbi:MAG: NUDIX domain-containing protein [Clostridium cadaveris]|uniref:NUDIX hydrolase n=1 Tax=Clostridium cadaveris TaxID=1529 RepID=UPI002A8CADF2|nr:NUDIX domain-containing protein [Clostridium cadaveris]